MAHQKLSIKESLSYGWKTFKKNWQFLVITFVIITLLNMVPSWIHEWSRENVPEISFVITIVGWLIQMVTGIGALVITLKIFEDKKPELTDIYKHYNLLLNYFLGSLIYALVVIGGIILLIIPGIIWGVKYQYITYFIIDKKMKPMEALRASGKITQGNKWKLFYLGLIFVGITILGLIPFGLGLVITWPIIMLANVFAYKKLQGIN